MVKFSILFIDIMENKRKLRADPDLKLMDQVQQVLRYHHAHRTENTYFTYPIHKLLQNLSPALRSNP